MAVPDPMGEAALQHAALWGLLLAASTSDSISTRVTALIWKLDRQVLDKPRGIAREAHC